MVNKEEISKLLQKVAKIKKDKRLDLSSDEDLSLAIMNLVSIEEHLFFTGSKTKKTKYFDLLNTVRKMRGELLQKIVKDPEGEIWCISKHLLAASMRLIEVGTKQLDKGRKQQAWDLYKKAYELYSLFWGLNLKLVDLEEAKKIENNQLDIHDENKNSLLSKLGEIVTKVINCCKE